VYGLPVTAGVGNKLPQFYLADKLPPLAFLVTAGKSHSVRNSRWTAAPVEIEVGVLAAESV
jgi:hypothetical protein